MYLYNLHINIDVLSTELKRETANGGRMCCVSILPRACNEHLHNYGDLTHIDRLKRGRETYEIDLS